jgi:hypothetical protein
MASLAALALYALADASALPVERVDLPTALRCGPEALHAHLAQVLPDAAAYGALQEQDKWRWRLDTWPYGNRHHDPVAPSSDPATVAWAYLAARAGLIPASNTPGYQHAYRQLTAVLAPLRHADPHAQVAYMRPVMRLRPRGCGSSPSGRPWRTRRSHRSTLGDHTQSSAEAEP